VFEIAVDLLGEDITRGAERQHADEANAAAGMETLVHRINHVRDPGCGIVRVTQRRENVALAWIRGVCEANGISIHYLRTGGAKPPVVLLHGLMGNGACWTPLARALEGEFDVVMPDARGHGGSSAPHHGYRYDDLASDVAGLTRSRRRT
jgi:predicted alpha/beta-fold hydrolase